MELETLRGLPFSTTILIIGVLFASPSIPALPGGHQVDTTISQSQDFSINVTPDTITIGHTPGDSASIIVTSINNFAGAVTLVSSRPRGLATGPDPTSVTLTPNATATSILYFDTYFVPPGGYIVNVTGTSGTLTHSTTLSITLVGPDFSISATQTSSTVVPMRVHVNASQVSITSIDNFSGQVHLSAYSLQRPSLQTAFNPGTVSPSANGTVASELSIFGPPRIIQPVYDLVVYAWWQGPSFTLAHTVTIRVTLKQPPVITSALIQQSPYTNAANGFSINPPAGWSVDESGAYGTAVIFYGPTESNFRVNMNIVVQATSLTLTQYVSESKSQLSSTLTNYAVDSEGPITVGSLAGYQLVATFTQGPYDLENMQVLIVENQKAYVVTSTALQSSYATYSSTFSESYQTFKLVGAEFPRLFIMASGIIAAGVAVGLAIFFRRKKQGVIPPATREPAPTPSQLQVR